MVDGEAEDVFVFCIKLDGEWYVWDFEYD